jgi:hypothetical protein
MLLAFINPSGPTREPQELAVLLINIGHTRVSAPPKALACFVVSIGPLSFNVRRGSKPDARRPL